MRAIRTLTSASSSSLISFGSRPRIRPEFLMISVPMWPGITSDACRCGAFSRKSLISASVKPFTANFAAL